MKKKLLSFLLALTFIVSAIPFGFMTVYAKTDDIPTIYVESIYAASGSESNVHVKIKDNSGIAGAIITVTYDPKLTLTEAESGEAFAALDYTRPGAYSSPCNFTWDSESAVTTEDGIILTLTFKISSLAEANDILPISISYRQGDIYDGDLNSVTVNTVSGNIAVINYIPGDVNDDGVVNGKDVTLIRRYNAGGYEVSINEAAADVNDDGVINGKDVTLIRRYNAGGYDVELKPSTPKCSHNMEHFSAKDATCTEDGNIEYWHCSICEKYFNNANGSVEITNESIVIKASHKLVHYAYKEPTYTQAGNKEYWKCSICGKYFENGSATVETTLDNVYIAPLTLEESTILYDLYGTDNYLKNCGVHNPNPDKFITSEGLVLQDLVGPEGYKFKGWKNSSGDFVTSIAPGTQSGMKVYAQWEEQQYIITYNVLKTPVESLIKITDDYDPYHFTVSKGKPDLPNPEMKNYVFLGWYDDEGNEIQSIPAGTAKDITLTPYYTSMRYLAKANTQTDTGFIVDDYDGNRIYYIAEIGTIYNIPLANLWDSPIMSRAGLDSTVTKSYSVSTSKTQANAVAEQLTKSTTDSNTWTLSKDWNNTTQVNKEVAQEQNLTQEQATTQAMSSSGTISLTNSFGGKNSTTKTDGTTTLTYDTKEKTKGNSQELDVGIGGEIGLKAGGLATLGSGEANAKVNAHIDGKFEWHNETTTKTGTEKTEVHTTVKQNEMSWNSELSKSFTQQASTSTTVRNALSKAISEKYGYGETYAEGGSNSQSQQFSHSASETVNSSTTLTYSDQIVTGETQTFHANGNIEGKYMLVQAGTAHVFAVVGYDIATQSFFTYTYNVMDDVQYQYLDYSPLTSNFDDCQYSVLPFEVPGFVYDYVATMTAQTDGLGFRTNSESGTAVVTSYNGTDTEVSIPNYVVINNTAYKVTAISATAFAGKNITAIMLNDFINEIPAGAFENCIQLKDVIGNFTIIGDHAFSGCESLESFRITENVVSVGTNAFKNAQKINAKVSNPAIISAVTNSGAHSVSLDISLIDPNNNLTVIIPEMNYFELLGGNRTFTNLKIESKADTTVLRQLRIVNDNGIPLDIYSENLTLDTVYAQSESYVMMLHVNAAEISLISDSSLASNSGNAIVCKNPRFTSISVGSVDGYLRIKGNIYLCGTITGNQHLDLDGEIVSLGESEFDDYIKGMFNVTFDPNGGNALSESDKTLCFGNTYGELPTATRDYYTFLGWFTAKEGGTQIVESTVFNSTEDITLYAHWTLNPVVGWVRASEMPSDAQLVGRKWSYDYTSNSPLSENPNYTIVGSSTSWSDYGAWSDWSSTAVSASDYRQVETKDVAAVYKTQYHYYRYTNSAHNRYGTKGYSDCTILERITLDYELTYDHTSSGIEFYGSYGNYLKNCWMKEDGTHSGPSPYTTQALVTAAHTEYRYRDRSLIYHYNLETANNPTGQTGVSNVVEWVQYRKK